MPEITRISPEILRDRHRLSPQQINFLYQKEVITETHEQKAQIIGKLSEFLRITDALKSHGIEFLPLKGPLLSFRLYGDGTIRDIGDIDILTDVLDIPKAISVLESNGYLPYEIPWSDSASGQRILTDLRSHVAFYNPEKGTVTELHWRLMKNYQWNFLSPVSLVNQNKESITFMDRRYNVLGKEVELLYLLIHGGFHHWSLLKWLLDVRDYLRVHEIDWSRFTGLSNAIKADRLINLCNQLLKEYFPGSPLIPISEGTQPYLFKLSKESIEGLTGNESVSMRTSLRHLCFALCTYPGLGYKSRFLWTKVKSSLYFGRIGKHLG